MQLLIFNKDIINNSRVLSLGLIPFQEENVRNNNLKNCNNNNKPLASKPPLRYIWLATIIALTGMFLDSVKHCTPKQNCRGREFRGTQYFTFVTKKGTSCANTTLIKVTPTS